MRRILAGFGLFAMLVVLPTRPAAAQARGYFGLGAGVSIPTGNFADGGKTGWIGHVGAACPGPKGMIGGGVNGTFRKTSFDVGGGTFRPLGAMGDVVVSPMT